DSAAPLQPEPEPDERARQDREMAEDAASDTVIVLPDSALLMPVLHHLPDVDINISMGYALSRSPLFRLLDTLLRLQENKRGKAYYWRDLIDFVRHPYIMMLLPLAGDECGAGDGKEGEERDRAPLRRELHRLEQALREQGRAYADPAALLLETYSLLPEDELPPRPVLELLERVLRVFLAAFAGLQSPREAGLALAGVAALLLDHGRHLWERFPIDAECLYRLRQSLVPELTESRLAGERFSPGSLFAILRSLMQAERVPFDASPLVGLQVMGMLETRLLSFRRVCIVDAVDDALPGAPVGDPLLPESLRPELGLPPLHSREQTAAYSFFRLLAGARDIALLWREGGGEGVQEQKRQKSRFVEELLWQEEKKLGQVLDTAGASNTPGPLRVLGSGIEPVRRRARGIRMGPEQRALLRRLLARPVSASLLDAYLRCPVQFYHERVAALMPASGIREGEDPLAVGNLLHRVLHECYGPHLGSPLPGGSELSALMREELLAAFRSHPDYLALGAKLPADAFATLRLAGEKRLTDFLAAQPPATVIGLESSLAQTFQAGDLLCTLYGKADRIDLRQLFSGQTEGGGQKSPAERSLSAGVPLRAGGELVIVDYKSGSPPYHSPELWDDAALWAALRDWTPDAAAAPGRDAPSFRTGAEDPDEEAPASAHGARRPPALDEAPDPLLQAVYKRLESVQLPLYLLLLKQQLAVDPDGAAAEGGAVPGFSAGKDAGGMALSAYAPGPGGTLDLNACWVALASDGKELPLFGEELPREKRAGILEDQVPELLRFLLRHMLGSPEYKCKPGVYCDWCSCVKLCTVAG
ncbi:PD-(D/E)XK nuclease family protein, partial [Desulfovibrio sp. OttesenSCG-928-A18]|nr:PD-(D/E)XK nuclease family protein [Desulfovibrio sp. OttesenSCG-928-A18]